jgi:hypothetical protein
MVSQILQYDLEDLVGDDKDGYAAHGAKDSAAGAEACWFTCMLVFV